MLTLLVIPAIYGLVKGWGLENAEGGRVVPSEALYGSPAEAASNHEGVP